MRITTIAFVVGLSATAGANSVHHSSSGTSEAACIRWEPIPVDMAGVDLGDSSSDDGGAPLDLGAPDLGASDPHAGMRCVERAGLFGCSFAPSGAGGPGVVAILIAFALTLGHRRRRQRTRV
jgi:MYXO-CTERM domain-containing protein